jgi:tripartite-type tricarboxylate transporter receptor subunit TctC
LTNKARLNLVSLPAAADVAPADTLPPARPKRPHDCVIRLAPALLACAASAGACLVALAAASGAHAQTWPSKPIRIVVPFPPGGTSDILARIIGNEVSQRFGQQIVVDNRPGASGGIGAGIVAKSPADGYTLLLADVGSLLINQVLSTKAAFDLVRDFSPVTMLTYSAHLLCVHPNVPASTVPQLVALAKKRPGGLSYASSPASAPYLAGVLFAQRAGIKWEIITGRGGAQSAMDVVTGQADAVLLGMLQTLPHVKSGRLKLLAVSSEKRAATLPDTPAVAETFPGFVTGSWQGLLAPAGTPADVVSRLHAEVTRALAVPDVKEKLASQGTDALGSTSADAARFLSEERDRIARIVREGGIKMAL